MKTKICIKSFKKGCNQFIKGEIYYLDEKLHFIGNKNMTWGCSWEPNKNNFKDIPATPISNEQFMNKDE